MVSFNLLFSPVPLFFGEGVMRWDVICPKAKAHYLKNNRMGEEQENSNFTLVRYGYIYIYINRESHIVELYFPLNLIFLHLLFPFITSKINNELIQSNRL